jgi:tRNA-(ms[2]io[6]A)-hydroxylase
VAERKRLPILQEPKPPAEGGEDEAASRPPWHWVGFGTVAIFAAWLPLAYAAAALAQRALSHWFGDATSPEEIAARLGALSPEDRVRVALVQTVPHALALALASFGGGFLVGRFGPNAGAREAAVAGVAVSLVAILTSCGAAGGSLAVLVVLPIAVGFSAWGGTVGGRAGKSGKKTPEKQA